MLACRDLRFCVRFQRFAVRFNEIRWWVGIGLWLASRLIVQQAVLLDRRTLLPGRCRKIRSRSAVSSIARFLADISQTTSGLPYDPGS